MANYSDLKSSINSIITTNGNNEITGALLNQVLTSMIDSLGAGYQFAGIANLTTNPGTPDQRLFYIASTPGVYSNFSRIELYSGEIAILKWDGAWTKETTGAMSESSGAYKTDVINSNEFYESIGLYGDFVIGGLSAGNLVESIKYRVASNKLISFDRDVEFEIDDGFEIDVHRFVNGSYSSSTGWQKKRTAYFNAGETFKIQIRRNPENTNIPAQLSEFVDKVRIITKTDIRNIFLTKICAQFLLAYNGTISGNDIAACFHIGNITISNNGWTYSRNLNRVCTRKNVTLRLNAGDIIYLSDYSDARFVIGGLYDNGRYVTQGWITSGTYEVVANGEFVILLAEKTESEQSSIDNLLSLLIIERYSIQAREKKIELLEAASGVRYVEEVVNWEDGVFLDNSGNRSSNPNWKLSEIINLKEGQTIVVGTYGTGSAVYMIRLTNSAGTTNVNVPGTNRRDGNRLVYHSYTAPEDCYVRVLATNTANVGVGWAYVLENDNSNFPAQRGWSFIGENGALPNIDTVNGTITFPHGFIVYGSVHYEVAANTVVSIKSTSPTTYNKFVWNKATNTFRTLAYPVALDGNEFVVGSVVTNGQAEYTTFINASFIFDYTINGVKRTLDYTQLPDVRRAFLATYNHRGFNTEAPENTIPAFRLSAKRGFVAVETDVRFTSDGVPVLLHDATINRTARNSDGSAISATINIADITYEQALTYDFGIWKSPNYAGVKIPTFEQFVILCRNLGLKAYVELKVNDAAKINLLNDIAVRYKMGEYITYISYDSAALNNVLTVNEKARVGLLTSQDINASLISTAQSLQRTNNEVFIDANKTTLTGDGLQMAIDAGIAVEVYVINTVQDALAMDDYISGVTSDVIDVSAVIFANNLN